MKLTPRKRTYTKPSADWQRAIIERDIDLAESALTEWGEGNTSSLSHGILANLTFENSMARDREANLHLVTDKEPVARVVRKHNERLRDSLHLE